MGKQLSFDLMENYLQEISAGQDSDNRRQIAKAKRLLRQVIQNDLTTRQREMVLLYFAEHRNMSEIAGLLQVNKSTVSRTIKRALNKLYKYLRYYNFRE